MTERQPYFGGQSATTDGWVPTTCLRCAVRCGHTQRGADERYGIADLRDDGNHPVSRGLACQRGIEESSDPDGEWLSAPLVRKGDDLVETRRASVPARAPPDPTVPEGTVWPPIHHPMTNDLTIPATDPQSAEPNFEQCAARVVGGW